MLEKMIENAEKPVTQALVTISNGNLEVYSARIRLDAHFRGLRYFMYYHPVSTAIVFTTMFLVWEALFSVIAWRSFVSWWQNKIPTPDKTLITPEVASNTNLIDNNQDDDDDSDKTWLEGQRERNSDDNGTTAESESEYEPSRPGSVISPTDTALVSESGETNYDTESDEDELQSFISRPLGDDDSSVVFETDNDPIDDDDQTEGSATPTTRSRRSTISEASTNKSEFEDRPSVTTSTSRLQGDSTRVHNRRAGGGNDSNME
jgi:hypothetical protein